MDSVEFVTESERWRNEQKTTLGVEISEAALIAHFQPDRYKRNLLSFPNNHAQVTGNLQNLRYTRVVTLLDMSTSGSIRLWSPHQPTLMRYVPVILDVSAAGVSASLLTTARKDLAGFAELIERERRDAEASPSYLMGLPGSGRRTTASTV
ncbi:hypothetical protein ACFXO9_31460 [Nocardia tengchongensis]|uniref:hypothetical protein n=1 Tax=Nocardia tengchongensis TaxID=2055889 RepID=UPI0036CFFB8C